MNKQINKNQLISHEFNPDALSIAIAKIKTKIIQAGDKPHVTVAQQLELLNQLCCFDFGRFLIQNGGANGYWTHYFLMHPQKGRITGKNNRGENFSDLEKKLLDSFPSTLATQQRFAIFLKENQQSVKNHAKLACIPCGMMGELLHLDFTGITDIEIIGIDLDLLTMEQAKNLAYEKKIDNKIKLFKKDAWQLNITNKFDLISSNGLNIYEPDVSKVTELYRQFYQALAPDGKLVTSFLTYPPIFPDKTEWQMEQVDVAMFQLQRIVFVDVLNTKFNCFMTSLQMKQMLEGIGFKALRFIQDEANIMPTVVASKHNNGLLRVIKKTTFH